MPKQTPKGLKASRDHGTRETAPPRPEKVDYLEIDKLLYDEENPRVNEFIVGKDITQKGIEEWLLSSEMKARELVPSFIENGFIPYEPLIVRNKDSKFIVIEGNRRLAAIRSMERSDDPKEREAFRAHGLNKVPCLIFSGIKKELLAYLGLRHLSKTRDWSTSAKGAFVERILKEGIDLSEAGRLTNTSPQALRLVLLTRRLFEEAIKLGLNVSQTSSDNEIFFWYLGDAIRRTHTKNYLDLEENPDPLGVPNYDQSRFESLITWIFGSTKEGRPRIIKSIQEVRILDKCLGNERAKMRLEDGSSLEEASEELEAAGANIVGYLDRARRSLQRAIGNLSDVVDSSGLAQIEVELQALNDALRQFSLVFKSQARQLTRKKKSV